MSKTIAICNQKGGVGKTTTAINLSAALALSGQRILLVDLDPQANTTGGLGIDKKGVTQSIYQLLLEDLPATSAIVSTQIPNLELIPSQAALSGAEIELVGLSQREGRLKKVVELVRPTYDLIFIDCPPSLGLLTVNALTAADSVLVPLQCEYYALEGLSQLLETIRLIQGGLNPALVLEGVLMTMADFRTKLTNDVIQEVRRYFGSKVYDLVIPRSVRLSEAPSRGLPICLYDPDSAGARSYHLLGERIKENANVRDTGVRQRDPGPDPGGFVRASEGGSRTSTPPGDPAQPISAQEGSQ